MLQDMDKGLIKPDDAALEIQKEIIKRDPTK